MKVQITIDAPGGRGINHKWFLTALSRHGTICSRDVLAYCNQIKQKQKQDWFLLYWLRKPIFAEGATRAAVFDLALDFFNRQTHQPVTQVAIQGEVGRQGHWPF